MKLYLLHGSTNCRKVLAVIDHLGLDVDLAYMDFFKGDLGTDAYRAINPNGMVPTLVDGERVMWESNAIMIYLADKVPGNSLFPGEAAVRADIVRWQCWELAHYNKALGTLTWETIAKPQFLKQEPNQALADWATEELTRFAPILNGHLEGRSFVVGDHLTLADYSLCHLEPFRNQVPFDWTPYANLNRYYRQMGDNPHWSASAAKPEEMGRKAVSAT